MARLRCDTRTIGMDALCTALQASLLLLLSCALLSLISASASSNEGLSSFERVTLQVHHRDSPSSPVRSLLAAEEDRLRHLLDREAAQSENLRIHPSTSDARSGGSWHQHANPAPSRRSDAGLWQGPRQRDTSTSPLVLGPTIGEFVTTIAVGTPARDAHVLLDITNAISWLQCETCVNCFRQSGAAFNPKDSTSYASIACLQDMCYALPRSLRDCILPQGECGYKLSYTDGTSTTGLLGSDTFFFGSPQVNLTQVPFGCSTNTTTGNSITTQVFDGVLSLGMGAASFAGLFLPRFSYCLPRPFSSNGGYLTLGGTNPPGNGSVSFNFYQNAALPAYYYVPVLGISVFDNVTADMETALMRTRAGAGVVLDFSHLVSYLVPQAYTPLKETFRSSMEKAGFKLMSPTPEAAPSYLETCYSLPLGLSLTTGLPPVKLLLEGGFSMPLSPQNYLLSTGHDTYCFAFAPAVGSLAAANVSVLGSTIQQGFDITFDLASKRISLSPHGC